MGWCVGQITVADHRLFEVGALVASQLVAKKQYFKEVESPDRDYNGGKMGE
jgi:hypothetical protein